MSDQDNVFGLAPEEEGTDPFGDLGDDFGQDESELLVNPKKKAGRPRKIKEVETSPENETPVEAIVESETPVENKTGGKKTEKQSVLTPLEKAIRLTMRRAGVETLPELSHLMRGLNGVNTSIRDIAIFIGEPSNDVLNVISKSFTARNTINLSAEVELSRVIEVGSQILSAGRVFQPIMVVSLQGTLQCVSGRHRLAFLAMAYGTDIEIPVDITEMSENEARDAVVYANDCRRTKAMEKAEHAALRAVGGDIEAGQDELYCKMSVNKTGIKKYCIFSVVDRQYPASLTFEVALQGSRKNGLTTLASVENFFSAATVWAKDVSRDDFDASLKSAVNWLNIFVKEITAIDGFNAKHHLANMTLVAVGKWFESYSATNDKVEDKDIAKLAEVIVGMGEIGRQTSDKTYTAICKAMRK